MEKILPIFIIFTLFLSVGPIQSTAAGNTLSVGTVQIDNVQVLSLPRQGSTVITTLKKSDEFPVLSKVLGDSSTFIMHTVISGNTLWKIANQYGVSLSDLQRANKFTTSEIRIGQQLIIPQKSNVYTVIKGDTIWKISNKYGVSMSDMIKLNNLRSSYLDVGQKLLIPDYYVQLQLLGGKKGWVKSSLLQLKSQERIVMGWKYNGSSQNYARQLNHSNLNVVSPRWYTLTNSGNFVSITSDTKYLKDAHSKGKKVWPLFGNKFDPVLTDTVLNNAANRQKLVSALKNSLIQTKSDGINVDFENIDPKNKQDFVFFITELKKALQPHGIKVSVDVTRENIDPFWSGSLDRKELGKIADYIVMMGYDEHWGGSPVAGSVASIPWVKEGVELLMKDVPSHKIVLAVPFYTREWVTNLTTKKVNSIDRTMDEVERIISSKGLIKVWDPTTQQNYVEYTANGEKHQIWVEDKQSIKLRIDLANQFNLGGVAAWYIGSETLDIWDVYHFNK
ncbi:LysM peptidoglycan-binding domain-containing protein [Psychrobacillus sp. OK032]|uniref:LysM peptidoglycan-binding domain-containing protein n=1 Tax=Psychrobacillus sp. OK032 TaxID=1884358 RepID=UPI0008B5912A|nr:LysM peptidoglycan-binding domain-containing protein [Psychrobacillus sp. OK032]SER79247.1 Spore germination protein YaaH [Psychrobacillus sp. OK032]